MSAAALSILVVTFTSARKRNIALGVWARPRAWPARSA
jgi:hypothetical protein